MTLRVRLDVSIDVDLPEGDGPMVEINGETDAERLGRAIEVAVEWIQQSGQVFLDGEDAAPAVVFCDVSDNDVQEVVLAD